MTSKGSVFFNEIFFSGGHPNISRNRTGHRLELNNINCEN